MTECMCSMLGVIIRRSVPSSLLGERATKSFGWSRWLRAAARDESPPLTAKPPNSSYPLQPRAQGQRKKQAPVQAPPWIRSRTDLESRYWLGRKAAQIPWVKQKFDALVKNDKIHDWESYFEGKETTVRGANTLLRVLLARRQPRRALDMFYEMQKRGLSPDRFAYINAISACGDLKDHNKGATLFQEMKSKCGVDRSAYVTLMNCFASCGQVDNALAVMDQAKASGIVPDRIMYTAMLTAHAHKGNLSAALKLLQDMRMAGQHPDAVAYNAVLHACARARDGYKALDIFEEMRQFCIPRDTAAYNSVLQACSGAGLEEDGSKLLNEMLHNKYEGDKSIAPTIQTYTIIIQYFANIGELESATSMMASMVEEGIQPDAKVYASLMDACIFHAAWAELIPQRIAWAEKADVLLSNGMRNLSAEFQSFNAELLLTKSVCVWALTNNVDKVRRVLSRFDQFPGTRPGPLVFAALLNMCERCCDGKLALETLSSMEERGMVPSASFWCRAALAYIRANNPEPGLEVLRRAIGRGIRLSGCGEWRAMQDALGKQWVPPNDWDFPHDTPRPSKQQEAAYQRALADLRQ